MILRSVWDAVGAWTNGAEVGMKPSKSAPFEVARSDDAIYVRIRGLGSMSNAPTLEAFAETAIGEGARKFVVDLEHCTGVDSTFMGLLLTIANRLREADGGDPSGVVLINVDDHARKQLSSVGVDAFLTLLEGRTKLPSRLQLTELTGLAASDKERLKLMVRAHRELIAADARNRAKFGAFLDAIVAELE